ncbi:ABC transporter permease [Bacillus sp. BGMRC 2118]|nr:ABC transporter permease [Bacillus sp. BGMRC 2118]
MTFPQFVIRNVLRNKRTYSAYFFSSAFSVLIFFVFSLFIFHPDIDRGVTAALAVQMMGAAEVLMYVFSFMFVLYSVSTFLKTRKREFGILIMHGMTRSQLNWMVFLENMIIGVGAIALGTGLGMLTGKLFLMIGSKMIGIPPLEFYVSSKGLLLTIIAFLLLFLFISIATTFLVKTNKLLDLFQSYEKPKTEPKVSKTLAVIAAMLLFISYYLAATSSLQTLLMRMLPVIAMTVIGTYFFYTQLSVFIIKLLQKNRLLFWRKTNLVTISSLAYRLKDNARMFFMVTIVSTIAFCAVGSLASINVMTKEFIISFPAAITYLSQDQQSVHEEHLQQIESELNKRNISYESNQVPIKFVEVASNSDSYPIDELVVISFSSYQNIAQAAGFQLTETPLRKNEVLSMKQSHLDVYESENYTLKQDKLILTHKKATEHVVVPYTLVQTDGIVVSDELYEKLAASTTGLLTGFYTDNLEKTAGMGGNLVKDGRAFLGVTKSYSMTVSGTMYEDQLNMYKMMLFVALLMGAVFFIAAGSFLYFRLYSDLEYDQRLYVTIKKVGLTNQELDKIVSRQLTLLFFVPFLVAVIHSIFAFMALQSFYAISIATEVSIVFGGFFLAQLLYFLLIRSRYLHNLKKAIAI